MRMRRPLYSVLAVSLLVMASAAAASAQVKIYIMTDLEGVSGVYKFAQTRDKDTPLNIQASEYFMQDLAAVVRGLRMGGATEILVLDGHGPQAIIPHMMPPGAKYITGKPRPGNVLWGLDKTFAGIVQFGAHAMKGTEDGVLNHTQSSKSENRYWYNGIESGELAQTALLAGHYGVPTIMVTGDEATCREATKFFGPACVTVAVKQGISREAAILYPFEQTRQALSEGAYKAIKAIPKCRPYVLDLPIKARMEYLDLGASEIRLVTREWTIPDALHLFDR